MPSKAATVDEYLAELSDDRRAALSVVREEILRNLPEGYEEGMQYGMIGYYVPHRVYPRGYHCDPKQPLPFAGMASQKGHMSLYLCSVYHTEEELSRFTEAYRATGKKLDMGKACVRFQRLEDLPLEVVGEAIARCTVERFVATYEASLAAAKSRKKA
jgi:hypothetical protein